MGIVIASADGDLREIEDYALDLAFGSDENDFKLTCDPSLAPPLRGYAYIDGTEYGGTVDAIETDTATGLRSASGRTWHGILASRVLVPDEGQSHLKVSGDVGSVLSSLIARMGLDGLFYAEAGGRRVSHTFARFCDGYAGIRAMLKGNGMKLRMSATSVGVRLYAEDVAEVAGEVDSERVDFTATERARCLNHLVCAGAGEGADRTVIHLYADEHGEVSRTQTLFGADEVCGFYDYSGADEAELVSGGTDKLKEAQGFGGLEITVPDGISACIGDLVRGSDASTGATVTAEVAKAVVKVAGGVLSVSYEVGDASASGGYTSTSSSSASGGGSGHAYYAGRGLTLTDWRFDADVDKADLRGVETKVDAIQSIPQDYIDGLL